MKINLIAMIFVLSFLGACASKLPKKNPQSGTSPEAAKVAPPESVPSMEAKQLANENETSYVTEFSFKKGSDELSPNSKKKLKEISKKAMQKGKIEMIKVITWADQEYPSASKKQLSSEQKSLAENRNKEIKKYLNSINSDKKSIGDIELISMAERPGFLNNLFSSEDTRIKKSLESAGIPNSENKEIKTAKSSKSIVLILMKGQKK